MIRSATPADAEAIKGLIRGQHLASKYAGRVGISEKALQELVFGMLAQQHQAGPQGSFVMLAIQRPAAIERDARDRIVGFMAGVLDRVYHIGDRLTANDLFLVNEGGRIADTLALIDAYIAWAKGNRRVMEIMLSWSDALPGAERVAELYGRKGFVKTGEMFEMRLDAIAEGIAA